MRYTLLLLFNGLLCLGCCSQERKSDLKNLELKGKVRSMKVDYYSFEYQDSVLVKKIKKWDYNEKQELAYNAAFNENGFYDTLIMFYDSTSIDTSYYQYDNKGFLAYIFSYDTLIIKCNKYGNVIETEMKNESVLYSDYNSDGNLIYSKLSNNGGIMSEYKATFNDGKVISESYFEGNKKLISKITYKHTNNQTESTHYSPEKEVVSISKAQKDSLNNAIRITYEDTSGFIYATETIIYKYDGIGNWIKRFKYLDNKPILLTERNIKYYLR